jgi:hypothetical protein
MSIDKEAPAALPNPTFQEGGNLKRQLFYDARLQLHPIALSEVMTAEIVDVAGQHRWGQI